MQKVVSINLNGNAYQLEESGYDTLRAYLAGADQRLQGNPDRAEIVADLEQAIADRCLKHLGPHKTVVSAAEIDRIVAEMGPVDEAGAEGAERPRGSATPGKARDAGEAPRRLFRIPGGAMIAGVCSGLAAYFRIDVAIVRVAFALAALLTQGVGILVYVVMMFVIPEASTPEERAAAGDAPLNAKDVIARATKQYAKGRRQWRRYWRQQRREWQRPGWPPGPPYMSGPPTWAAMLVPVFALAHVALFLVAAATVISLVNTGGILNWQLPADVPLWAAVLVLFVAYQIVVSPVRAVERWTQLPGPGGEPAVLAFWTAAAWLIGLAFVVWIASNHIPEIREFVQRMPDLIRDFTHAVRDFFARQA